MTDLDALCARLFDAFAAHDLDAVAEMLAPGATITQNGTRMPWAEAREMIAGLMEVLGDYRYEDARRVVGDRAVVEEHLVTAELPNGEAIRLHACAVIRVDDDGRITEIDEYVDPTPLAAV